MARMSFERHAHSRIIKSFFGSHASQWCADCNPPSLMALVRRLCGAVASKAAAAVTNVCGLTGREAVEGARGSERGRGGGADLGAR